MKFFALLFLSLFFLSFAIPTHAKCRECDAWKSGSGAKPGPPTTCLVEIRAPTYGGQVGLDIRDSDGHSIWGAPRIKQAKPGVVTYLIGCSQLHEPAWMVYLCVGDEKSDSGNQYHSQRTREWFADALRTRRLDLCLKGPACKLYVPD